MGGAGRGDHEISVWHGSAPQYLPHLILCRIVCKIEVRVGNPGYVYVLMNPSMEGLVKVGRTERDPHQRAKELSATTGVPTPFIVVFDAYFEDCSAAEVFVHTWLEGRNNRVSSNREFFSAPVNEAVKAVIEAQRALSNISLGGEPGCAITSNVLEEKEPWLDFFEMATNADYGLEDQLEDHEEALRLYRKAAKLGCSEAFHRMGVIYTFDDALSDEREALANFKEGAARGVSACFMEMACIYFERQQFDNARKCWAKFFEYNRSIMVEESAWRYLEHVKSGALPFEFKSVLMERRAEVLKIAERNYQRSLEHRGGNFGFFEARLRTVRMMLFPELHREIIHGKVKWWNSDEGYGFVTLESGEDAFLIRREILDLSEDPIEGQPIQTEIVESSDGRFTACNTVLNGQARAF